MKIKSKGQATFKAKKRPKILTMKKQGKNIKKSNNLETMSVSEFLSGGFQQEDDSFSSMECDTTETVSRKDKKSKKIKKSILENGGQTLQSKNITGTTKIKQGQKSKNGTTRTVIKKKQTVKHVEEEEEEADEEDDGDNDGNKEGEENTESSHKDNMQNLHKIDPEFYKFLQQNDKDLLNFEDSEDDDGDVDDGDDVKKEKFHKLPSGLQVGSDDESDNEDDLIEKDSASKKKITLNMVEQWTEELKTDRSNKSLTELVEAFHAALLRVSPEEDTGCVYKVDGAAVFNAVLRMCMVEMQPALRMVLKWPPGSKKQLTSCKSWAKVKGLLKTYFTDLSQLMKVTSPSLLSVLLKHLHQMIPFVLPYNKIAQTVLKRLVQLWCTDEDLVRVLSFLCILRIARKHKSMQTSILKTMYLGYVRNTKFVTVGSKPGVNFMRRSLVEMFLIDDQLGYQHAFLYIRQLAIHLRNAVTLKKKEAYQTVYNWQYLSSIELWADVIGQSRPSSPLRSLLYPLVQITLGTVKLIPSPQYFPLRFHCVRYLTTLSDKTGVFIPVLPLLMEILTDYDLSKAHKKVSMKPIDLTCVLRCSRSQMLENGFKDAVAENVYSLLLEYFQTECHRLSFPDLVVPSVIQMKQFVKNCKSSNFTRKVKTVLDKVMENCKWIEAERSKEAIRLDDVKAVEAMEAGLGGKRPPFKTFYESWKKVHIQAQAKKLTDTDKIGDIRLPSIKKNGKQAKSEVPRTADGLPELFPSDDESDAGLEFIGDLKENVPKGKKRKAVVKEEKQTNSVKKMNSKRLKVEDLELDMGVNRVQDIVQDLDLSEFYGGAE